MKLLRYGRAIERLGQRYRLDGSLGSGGMADVCLAWDEHDKRAVAIKIIKPDGLDQKTLDRFLKEAAQIANWNHPNILRIYSDLKLELLDATQGQLIPYIVMEYAQNGDLHHRLRPGYPYPLPDTLTIFPQLCSAVAYAHTHGIIHRDLKPLNILFRRLTGGTEQVVLSDFGIAVEMAATHHTFAQAGTLPYMAPEQLRGHAQAASDIFSLGVILYQLCTGRLPFQRSLQDLLRPNQSALPPAPSRLQPRLPRALDEIIFTALAADPAQRFADADLFWQNVQAALPAGTTERRWPASPHSTPQTPSARANSTAGVSPASTSRRVEGKPQPVAAVEEDMDASDEPPAYSPIPARASHPGRSSPRSPDLSPPGHAQVPIVPVDQPYDLHTGEPVISGTPHSHHGFPTSPNPLTPSRPAAILHPPYAPDRSPSLPHASVDPLTSIPYIDRDSDLTPIVPDEPPRGRSGTGLPPRNSRLSISSPMPAARRSSGPARRPARRTLSRPAVIAVVALCMVLVGGLLIYSIPAVRAPFVGLVPALFGTTTVTITPASISADHSYVLDAVTGTPDPAQRQVPARLLSLPTIVQPQTVIGTGVNQTQAKQATGTLTFFNGSFTAPAVIGAGLALTGNDGVTVITDTQITIPVAVANIDGEATVSAHASITGSRGNITALDINKPCCVAQGSTILVRNTAAFTGGQDAQNYKFVQQSDVDKTVASVKQGLVQQAQGKLKAMLRPNEQLAGAPQCTSATTSDHPAGDQGVNMPSLVVNVLLTCQQVAYDEQAARALAAHLLTDETKVRPGYVLMGAIQTQVMVENVGQGSNQQNMVILLAKAQGRWVYHFGRVQQQALSKLIAGKSVADAMRLLKASAGVGNVAISPSTGTLPTDATRINIVVQNQT